MARKHNINFIGIGAQKAGTTWLYGRLNELSEFSMPYIKELHYFDRDEKYPSPNDLAETSLIKRLGDPTWRKPALKQIKKQIDRRDWHKFRWMANWHLRNYTDSWYLSLFDSLNGICGEITPSYSILDESDVKRMHDLLPDVKLIFFMRNPVDRAWSHLRFHLRMFPNEKEHYSKAENIMEFMNWEGQELRSDYVRTLDLYKKYFPSEQILIGYYDAIVEKPDQVLAEVVTYLGGDPSKISSECNLEARDNVSLKIHLPKEVEHDLKEKYRGIIKELSNRYGGYCKRWYREMYEGDDDDSGEGCKGTHLA